MLRRLPGRHLEVLMRRFGLNDRHTQTHQEIGEWLGVVSHHKRPVGYARKSGAGRRNLPYERVMASGDVGYAARP
jgi:hypothetical protein